MSTLNLNTLLESLEAKSALEKTASQQEVIVPAVSDEFAALLSKKSEQDLTKEAQAQGEALARMLLEKAANEIQVNDTKLEAQADATVVPTVEGTIQESLIGTVEQGLDRGATDSDVVDQIKDGGPVDPLKQVITDGEIKKEAQEMSDNVTLAQYIMQKLAEDASGEGSVGGAAPNNILQNDAVNQAFDESKVQELPNADASVNGIFEAIVARAKAQGGGTDDLVVGSGSLPAERDDNVEKAAAVQALVAEGCDFEDAVNLVKQAEEELNAEAYDQEKQAAFSKLVEAGIDFDSAVALIKQAEEDLQADFNQGTIDKEAGVVDGALKAAKGVFGAVKADAGKLKGQLSNVASATKANKGVFNKGTGSTLKALAKNKAVQAGAAGAVATGAAVKAVSGGQEKQAKDHILKGMVSPAWQEHAIAKDHGKKGPTGLGENYAKHVGGGMRAGVRAYAEGAGGAAAGIGLTALAAKAAKNKGNWGKVRSVNLAAESKIMQKAPVVAGVAALAGLSHGVYKSLKNQAGEAHKKYASEIDLEKVAAYQTLTEQGFDYETAMALIKQAEQDVYGE